MRWIRPEELRYCKECDAKFTFEHRCFNKKDKNRVKFNRVSYEEMKKHGINPLQKYIEGDEKK